MKDDYNGIEEYANVYEKEYCDEIIKHFEVMAEMQLHTNKTNLKQPKMNVLYLIGHIHNPIHYDFKLCDYFYKRLFEVYTTIHMEKYLNAKRTVNNIVPKGMSIQNTRPNPDIRLACRSMILVAQE